MNWLLLALTQLALLTVLLLVSAALLRRAQRPSRAKPMSPPMAPPAAVAGYVSADGATEDRLHQALERAEAAKAELTAGWTRVRAALHNVLESAQPVLEYSSWGELQRLLCAADQLIGTPSPTIAFRDDPEAEQNGRWGTLISGLTQLRAAAGKAQSEDAAEARAETTALDGNTTQAILGALVLAVDELRTANPEAAKHESSREMELRQMILQFTHDSRDMLTCIRRLESDNAALRSQLPEADAA